VENSQGFGLSAGVDLKTALVVGSTKETGSAIVQALRDEGHKVIGIARTGADIELDLMSPLDFGQAVLDNRFGSPDIIVHVVGGSWGIKDALSPANDYAKVWRLNLGIAIDINNLCIPMMIQRGWGRIVHLSSNATKLAIGYCPYASAKAAIEGYVRNVGKEFGSKGVVITAVRPGPIYTEGRWLYSQPKEQEERFMESYVPMKRWGKGEELAGLVKFLCSDQASYMAGAVVDCDGGMR
jgi:NAD(P)-dependent dehydrogenase (short-subunit alcohol dehydrogenase family)